MWGILRTQRKIMNIINNLKIHVGRTEFLKYKLKYLQYLTTY